MVAMTWWTTFFSDTLLSKVMQMLHNVLICAAPTERNWYLQSGVHTKLWNRMKVDTASQVAFIKHSLMLEHAYLFKPTRKQNQLQEQEEMEKEPTEEEIQENIIDGAFDVDLIEVLINSICLKLFYLSGQL